MPFPKNKKELQRFLGIINYLGKFVPNLSENTDNLRKLFEKDTEWHFDENHKKVIDKLKLLVTSPPVLKFYNPLLPIKGYKMLTKSLVRNEASSTQPPPIKWAS